MCGRYSQTATLEHVIRRFGAAPSAGAFVPRYNIAPGQQAPVVRSGEARALVMMEWGLIPSWTKPPAAGQRSNVHGWINARAETLAQKPSFRTPLMRSRCLVVADGFYEWQKMHDGRSKRPRRIVLKNREPFAFAGLWNRWQPPSGRVIESFTIITTKANDLLRPIHDRMPVILKREDEEQWLAPDVSDIRVLLSCLLPYASAEMESYEVSPVVNSPRNDRPECLLPVP